MESKTLKLSFADLPNFAALHESESDVVDGARSQQRGALG